MSVCKAVFTEFNGSGEAVGGGQMYLPPYLDWMPIDVKAFWFRFMGYGKSETTAVLLQSQGEQRLLYDVTLQPLDLTQHKEKQNGAEQAINQYAQERSIRRVPRGQ